MHIFYSSIALAIDTSIFIEGQEHIHLSRSLRKKEGDTIFVANGKGVLFEAKIQLITKKRTQVCLHTVVKSKKYSQNHNLYLAVAPTKNIGRYEWLVEKCIEIGVNSILPFTSFHIERKVLKNERLNTIAISAMKQSKQLFLPKIEPLTSFREILNVSNSFDVKLIAYCDELNRDIKNEIKNDGSVFVLIGPEGGFSPQEVEIAKENGFKTVTLGENRLRTETAAVYVASIYNVLK